MNAVEYSNELFRLQQKVYEENPKIADILLFRDPSNNRKAKQFRKFLGQAAKDGYACNWRKITKNGKLYHERFILSSNSETFFHTFTILYPRDDAHTYRTNIPKTTISRELLDWAIASFVVARIFPKLSPEKFLKKHGFDVKIEDSCIVLRKDGYEPFVSDKINIPTNSEEED